MADELIDILSKEGFPTGEIKLKSEAHKKGLWHASAQIWIYTPNGEILIQKRTPNKDTYPNLWDISVAGHLSVGDSPINAAIREIEEEIGLVVSVEALRYLKTTKNSKLPNKTIIDNEFNHLYICCYSIELNKLKLQEDEVSDVKLLSIPAFKNELQANYSNFVPHGMEYYYFIIECITSALDAKQQP